MISMNKRAGARNKSINSKKLRERESERQTKTKTSKIIDTRNAINIVDFEMDRIDARKRNKKMEEKKYELHKTKTNNQIK